MVVPVPDQLEYISDADGVTKTFPYPKRFLQKDEIVVMLRDADGVDTVQRLNIDYTISGSAWPTGGDVVFNIAPASGLKVVRYRMTQAKQTVDLENKQRNDAPSVELQLDRLTMAIQDRGRLGDAAWWGLLAEVAARVHGDKLLNDRVDQETIDRIAGDEALASLIGNVGSGNAPLFDTRLAVSLANIDPLVNALRTAGYNSVGDGGSALYKRVATEPSHAGKVQSVDGAWWELASHEVNVECLGAAGDGIADDTLAFTNAMSFFAAKGGGYLFATRVYNVPAGVELVSNVTLDGRGTGILNGLGVGDSDHTIIGQGISNVTIKDISSTVPRTNFRIGGMAILFAESSNIRISDCRTDGGMAGIWFVHCSDVIVTGCYVDTPKADGIHFGHGSYNCSALNNTVVNTGDDALATTYYDGYPRPTNIKFIGNTVLGTIWGAGVAVYSADCVVISDNIINGTALYGIVITNHDGAEDPSVVTITGNNLSVLCRADKVPYSYWDGTNPDDDPAVVSTLHMSGMAIGGSRIRVKSNSIVGVQSASGAERHGLSIDGGFSIVIEGNSFFGVKGYGIRSNKSGQGEIHILSNVFDYVDRIGVNLTHNWTDGGVIVANNVFGYGQQAGDPYAVSIKNVASGRKVHVAYNISNNGRGIGPTINSPGFLATGNLA